MALKRNIENLYWGQLTEGLSSIDPNDGRGILWPIDEISISLHLDSEQAADLVDGVESESIAAVMKTMWSKQIFVARKSFPFAPNW